ncbi:hypothetical protein [Priestia megaterium]|uniref:hypothetical protein n=1 Tax=Priestia megaterium TaxID=1404 RepID=UPI0031FC322D
METLYYSEEITKLIRRYCRHVYGKLSSKGWTALHHRLNDYYLISLYQRRTDALEEDGEILTMFQTIKDEELELVLDVLLEMLEEKDIPTQDTMDALETCEEKLRSKKVEK